MNLLHHDKYNCEFDDEKFHSYQELIDHTRHVHHHAILKCDNCGKEFIHEKDRLHHVREEHEKEYDKREHKDIYQKTTKRPQDQVDERTRQFSDNF